MHQEYFVVGRYLQILPERVDCVLVDLGEYWGSVGGFKKGEIGALVVPHLLEDFLLDLEGELGKRA